jgi:lambda family phage minor tail protein L
MPTITQILQQLHQDSPLVELYTLDLTKIGGSVYRYTPHFADGGTLVFASVTYLSMPIITEGWEVTSTGTQPRPTISLTNVNQVMLNAVITLGDLVGADVILVRTFEKFLDGKPGADPTMKLPSQVMQIEQKLVHTDSVITWQLSSILDKFGSKLPAQQLTRTDFPGLGRGRGAW